MSDKITDEIITTVRGSKLDYEVKRRSLAN